MIEIKAPHDGWVHKLDGEAFTEMCKVIHEFNTQWWLNKDGSRKDRNVGEMLMLMTSELSEALEAHRKNLQDDKLDQFHGVDVELVDCIIRAMDLLGARYKARYETVAELLRKDPGVLLETASELAYTPGEILEQKSLYNSTRADHRPENRQGEPGQKDY